eukprot:7157684-Pyramimonas_sp.AAC.1
MQEAHGTETFPLTLDRDAPNYSHPGSFCSPSAAGGATISVPPRACPDSALRSRSRLWRAAACRAHCLAVR